MNRLKIFKQWWEQLAAPPEDVERELAWRGYVLNTLLLGMILFSIPFAIANFTHWLDGLDDGGGVIAAISGGAAFVFILWVSRTKSIILAIRLLSSLLVVLSFILSFGWGVADITTNAFYVMAITLTSFLLQHWFFAVVSGALLVGYVVIGWAELDGWFTPPFYTELGGNYINVAVILLFLTFLGYITAQLVDKVLAAQVMEAARRQELESRTRIAAEVQMSMLPAEAPIYASFDIAGQSLPALNVGGDFYDYHQLASGQLAIIIGDVTGKGMSAALLMAVTTGMIDSLIPTAAEPIDLLLVTASRLQKHSQRSGLNAACLAAFLRENGDLCVANAGCIAPIIRRTNDRLEWLKVRGLPMGVESDFLRYEQVVTTLEPGDLIIFTTDGIVEAQNKHQGILGFDRLERIIASGPTHSAQAMKNYILNQVQLYQHSVEQFDDMTVVVVRVKRDLPLVI
ncbi:MAG: PP2C family protein-serine/threonine phosphatase [Anaerolineae bacterium]|nr:PP2C family protein-serine/threonine phosphatase [Anaerolineae bacterium]